MKAGNCFGEIALMLPQNKRTAVSGQCRHMPFMGSLRAPRRGVMIFFVGRSNHVTFYLSFRAFSLSCSSHGFSRKTITATTRCDVFLLSRNEFDDLRKHYPALGKLLSLILLIFDWLH